MSDVAERIAEAKEHVVPGWTPERERLVRARVDVRVSMRRRWRRGFAVSLAFAAVLAVGLFVWPRFGFHPSEPVASRSVLPTLLRLEDGSTATASTPDAKLEPVEISPTVAAMRLLAGSARFSVTPNPNRVFRVFARDVTVTVLGTVFTVALEPGGVRVVVERGRVHVAWPAGERVLAVGEQAFIPDAPEATESVNGASAAGDVATEPEAVAKGSVETAEAAPDTPVGPSDETTPRNAAPDAPPAGAAAPSSARTVPATGASTGSGSSGTSWRTLAQDGDYAAAYERMQADPRGAVRDEPGDLLLAADVARLGGHPDRAIQPLERVVGKHPRDSRAPLAAFTLGRTFLDQLGRPREAAAAFATARRLAPEGAMAQDALAREVESWSRAGEASLARSRAEEYVSTYPHGRRLAAVRRLGGLE